MEIVPELKFKMRLIPLLFIFFICVESKLDDFKNVEPEEDVDVVVFSEIVTNYLYKYFYKQSVYIMIAVSSSNVEQKLFQEDIIYKLMTGPKFGYFSYNFLHEVDPEKRGNKNAFNLIFVDGPASLKKVLNKSTVQTFHLEQRYMIVITQSAQNATETLNQIFEAVQEVHLLEVNVLVKDENTLFWSLHFYMLYATNCHTFEVYEIDRFTQDNYTTPLNYTFNDIFPPKTFKFADCPLFVSTFPFQPFVIIRPGNVPDAPKIFKGLDVKIVDVVSKTLNLVPKYVQSDEYRGTIFDNGTTTGAIGMVINGGASMTIGGYSISADRLEAMSASLNYVQFAAVFAYAESNTFVTPFARLLAPFQAWLWISILCLLTISTLIILLTKKLTRFQRHFIIGGYKNRTPILNMLNGVIGGTPANRRMKQKRYFGTFARTLAILWVMFWLIVRNAYQGSLYGFLHSERVTSLYDTFDKVKHSNCNIHTISSSGDIGASGFDERRIRKHDINTFSALMKLSTGEWDGVVLTNAVSVNYFNFFSNSSRRIDYTRKIVKPSIAVFYFKKHSIFLSMFDKKISIFTEAGLIDRWLAQVNYEEESPKYKKARKLTITNISAILKITAVLYFISTLVFVMETLSGKYEKIRKFLDYLTY